MWQRVRTNLAIAALCIVGAPSCSSECDEVLIDGAREFINAHQQCQTDNDCAVGHVGCSELPGSFCGQVTLNRDAAQSEKWQIFEQKLSECGSGHECAVCAGALVPSCTEGSCGGAQ
jgi:hypothetical protein